MAGAAPGTPGTIRYRRNNHLCPDAPLDKLFKTGQKQLIPNVHVHGLMACAAEHTAVPMQLASHGYISIVPDMMDQSAVWTTDKDGKDIWVKAQLDQANIANDFREKYEIRKENVMAIGLEIKENSFLS